MVWDADSSSHKRLAEVCENVNVHVAVRHARFPHVLRQPGLIREGNVFIWMTVALQSYNYPDWYNFKIKRRAAASIDAALWEKTKKHICYLLQFLSLWLWELAVRKDRMQAQVLFLLSLSVSEINKLCINLHNNILHQAVSSKQSAPLRLT